MHFISTRGGRPVNSLDALVRGLSDTGGIYVPECPPDPIEFSQLRCLPAEMVMAVFFNRFIPDFSVDEWRVMTRDALSSLAEGGEPFKIPFSSVNDYLPGHYVLAGDTLPTGTLDDFCAAVMRQAIPRAVKKRGRDLRPFVVVLGSDDFTIAALRSFRGSAVVPALALISAKSERCGEASALKPEGWTLCSYDAREEEMFSELARIASDSAFDKALSAAGYEPVFLADSHPLRALAAGALAAASLVELDRAAGGIGQEGVDFVVARNDLVFLTGLVYASSVSLPVACVYIGEGESHALSSLLSQGELRLPGERKGRDQGREPRLPVNFEVLLFEIMGRNHQRLSEKIAGLERNRSLCLSPEETDLLRQSLIVSGCDFKRCQHVILSIYDQWDYLVDRGTAEAVACWASHRSERAKRMTCFIAERSPLLDYYICARSVFGHKEGNKPRKDAVLKLSDEAAISMWTSLCRSFDRSADPIAPLTASMRDMALNLL